MYKSLRLAALLAVLPLLSPSLLMARAPGATNDTYSTDYRTVLTVPAPGVLANDANGSISALTSQTYSFDGITFDQALTPNVYRTLLVGTYSNAVVTALPTGTTMEKTGFPDVGSGFYFSHSIGLMAEVSTSVNGTKALNLPAGDDGTRARSGFESSWASGVMLTNAVGDDFVIFEAGSTNVAEAYMVQVHNPVSDVWSSWVYITPQSYKFYAGSGSEGLHSTRFNLDSFGIPSNGYIDRIRVVNMTPKDRLADPSGVGVVIPEDNGATSTVKPKKPVGDTVGSGTDYPVTSFDPDIVYIGSLHTLGATVPSYSATSELGVTVTLNNDGSFTYDPTTSITLQSLSQGQTATDTFYYLIANATHGHSRAIVTVNVTTPALPALTITKSGNNVILRWPTSAEGFILQSTMDLAEPVWSDVDVEPTLDGDDFTVTLDATTGNMFFRLINAPQA